MFFVIAFLLFYIKSYFYIYYIRWKYRKLIDNN